MVLIEYRGWRTDGGGEIRGDYIVVEKRHFIVPRNATISFCANYGDGCFGKIGQKPADIWPTEIIPETVGQYIGIKDKNDKKIYQGDFVERYEITRCCKEKRWMGIFEVVWQDAGFYCKNESYGLLGWAGDDTREVIGNIIENPEMMEKL